MRSDTRRSTVIDGQAPPAAPDVPHRGDRWSAWRVAQLIFAALAVVYVATAPENRTESDDGHQFAYEIEAGTASHGTARHIAFVPVMHAVFVAVRAVGITDDAMALTSVVNALLAAAAVALQFLILRRRLGLSLAAALLGTGLLAASYGFWRFSTEIEVYSMALATGLAALFVGFHPGPITPWRAAGTAGLAAIAISAYSANVLLAAVVIPVSLVLARRWRPLAVYAVTLVPALVLAAAIPYLMVRQPGESFTAAYGAAKGSSFGVESLFKGGVGSGQAILSSGFLFSYPQFSDELSRRIPDRALADEIYLATTVSSGRRGAMTITFGLAVLGLLAASVMAFPALRRRWRQPAVGGLITWLAGVVGFQLSRPGWADGPELWLLALPPFTMLVALGLAGRRIRGRPGWIGAAVLLGLLMVHNTMGMLLIENADGDRNAVRADWLLGNATAADTILTVDSALFYRYLQYHSDAAVVFLVEPATMGHDLEAVLAAAAARDGNVYATGEVFDPPGYLEHQDAARYRTLVAFGQEIEPRFLPVADDEFGGVYRLLASDP